MKKLVGLTALLLMNNAVWACDEKLAFGFELGKPVPVEARDLTVFWFTGGSVPNALDSYEAKVPEPIAGFDRYGYWANRDRKVVYSVFAFRSLDAGGKPLADEAAQKLPLERAKQDMEAIRKQWHEKQGFDFRQADSEWMLEATTATVKVTIGVVGGEYLYVECTHRALEKEAMTVALKSWR